MAEEHRNEPRDIGYSKDQKEVYADWTEKDSSSIFAGLAQADLFFFAMAVGYNRERQEEPKNKLNHIPTSVLSEAQKWGILSTEIAKKEDLLVLKDEKPIYSEAEKYAEEGIKIIKSHIEKHGLNYPKYLEAELREILNKTM